MNKTKSNKQLIKFWTLTCFFSPLLATIACSNSEGDADLYIYSGKNENLQQLEDAAQTFEQLYYEAVGEEINVKVQGSGNGADVDTILRTLSQKGDDAPDIITSYGIGDMRPYIDEGLLIPISDDDELLEWAKSETNSIASSNVTSLLQEELSIKDENGNTIQYGLAMNYEAVGVVVNVKTLGQFCLDNFNNESITFGGKKINELILSNDDSYLAGEKILSQIYTIGWSWNELEELTKVFNSTENQYAFSVSGNPSQSDSGATWISGFHMLPNWLSSRTGSDETLGDTQWNGYRNTFETMYPVGEDNNSQNAFEENVDYNPLEYIAKNSDSLNIKDVETAIYDLYEMYFSVDSYNSEGITSMEVSDAFAPFGNGTSLFTHASTGMYPWMIETIGSDKISIDDIAPIPMPLNIDNGNALFKDIAVDVGMLWHLVEKDDEERSELAKIFLEWLSTGTTELTDSNGNKIEINDNFGVESFYNSESSMLVNPYVNSVSGGDLTSEIIYAEIQGLDWSLDFNKNATKEATDYVTLWTNGAIGEWGEDEFAPAILSGAGEDGYNPNVPDDIWNNWKSRLNINEL